MRAVRTGLSGRLRHAVARLVGPGNVLTLDVVGSNGPAPAAIRVTVRRRGGQGSDGGLLMALARRVRRVLALSDGARLPMLVIRCVAPKAMASLREATGDERGEAGPQGPERRQARLGGRMALTPGAEMRARARIGWHRVMAKVGRWAGLSFGPQNKERRRSRSPPSPWSSVLSPCGRAQGGADQARTSFSYSVATRLVRSPTSKL